MSLIKQAEEILGIKATPLTSLDKAILKRLPGDWLVFALRKEGYKKYKVKILLRRHGKAR